MHVEWLVSLGIGSTVTRLDLTGKLNDVSLIKKHGDIMSCINIWLYPQISYHQRSFTLQSMKIEKLTTRERIEVERCYSSQSWSGCFHQDPLFMAQENMWKKKRRNCKSHWVWKTPRKQYLPATTGLMHIWTYRACGSMLRDCTGVSSRHSSEKGKWTWAPIHNPEATTHCPLTNEKYISPIESHWGTNHT